MSKLNEFRKKVENLRDDVARWQEEHVRAVNDSRTDTERSYCDGLSFEDWRVLQHLDAILASAERNPKRGEWRDVADEDTFQNGDRFRSSSLLSWLTVNVTTPDLTVGEWKNNIEPHGGQVQRRVSKRPGLAKLVKRLPTINDSTMNQVEIMDDGSCGIYDTDGNAISDSFGTIAELKDYLAAFPERDA